MNLYSRSIGERCVLNLPEQRAPLQTLKPDSKTRIEPVAAGGGRGHHCRGVEVQHLILGSYCDCGLCATDNGLL